MFPERSNLATSFRSDIDLYTFPHGSQDRIALSEGPGEDSMKRLITLGAILLGGLIAFQSLSPSRRRRVAVAVRGRILKKMERIMASLPEDSPPKLVKSVLPRLRDQNDQIIRILNEQNELLREQRHTRQSVSHPHDGTSQRRG